MPAQSKQQQKFMGLVHAIQKGDVKKSDASPEALKVAKDMDPKDVKDFASTKHKGLPKRVKQEILKKLKEYAMTLPNHQTKPAAPMASLRSDDEMDIQEDRIPQNFNVGTTRDYHTKLATTPRKKYDKTNFEPAHSGQEDLVDDEPIEEAQAVSGGKVHKFITGKNLKFKGKSYSEIHFETLGVDNKNQTIRFKIIAPKEIFGNEMSLDFRTVRRGPFFKTDTSKVNEATDITSLKKIHDAIFKFLKTKKGVGEVKEFSEFPNRYGDNVSTFSVKYNIQDKYNYDLQEIKIEYSTSRVFIPNKGYFPFKTFNDIKNIINKKSSLKEYASNLDNSYILNKDAKLDGTPEEKDAIDREGVTEIKFDEIRVLSKEEFQNESGPCWKGYKQVGMKTKGGKQVPNCVKESVNEAKTYKKGDKLKIKLKNGKKIDVVFDMYARTKGVALGKFKDSHGEYDIKPFNLDAIVESVNEASKADIIKDLDKAKNDLLKKVDILIAKKKKLYSDVDIESPMSADEKKLDKDIADLFSQINKLVLQKRSLKESILSEKQFKGLEGIPSNVSLEKATTAQKLKIIKAPGNIIDFKVPKGVSRNFWQVIGTGKVKKNLNGEHYLEGKIINSPMFKSLDDLVDGVLWKSMEQRRRFNESVNEVGVGDWHFKAIQKMWQKAGAFTRKKIAAVITKNPNSSWSQIEREIKYSDYDEITDYTEKLGLGEIVNKLNKKSIKEELSFDEKQMVYGIIEILKQVEDPKNRMKIALNMLKKFKEENIEFDYQKFIDSLKEYSMGSYEYDKGNRELGESIIKSMKKVVIDLLPTNTLARHANDPSKNKEFVEKIVKELGTLLNRFYKQNDIDVILK